VPKSTAVPLSKLVATAQALADASGPVIRRHFRRPLAVDDKSGGGAFDPVTIADRAAEQVMIRLIAKSWPDHGVVGEEFGDRNPAARYRWVLDPIDGTRAFIMGSLLWGTLIGLLDDDQPVIGVLDQPFVGERFWNTGQAAFVRGPDGSRRKLATRACPRLSEAVLASTHPDLFEAGFEAAAFASVSKKVRMTRFGGDCYNYALLAAGHIDVVIEAGLKPHDIVALVPIIERAGGCVTTWTGSAPTAGGRIVASGDPRLHERVMRELSL
jgi:myo-inositol-1(or 4)-monophosphatase